MKICLAQTNIIWEEKDKNLDNAYSIIREASSSGADVVFFPEMSFTGFTMNTEITGENNNYTFYKLTEFASANNIKVGFGWVRKNKNTCENVYSILDENGILISEYIKIHPFSYSEEDKYFSGGDSVIRYQIKGIPFSTFICYDLRFPETFRMIANNVHMVIIPACWPAKRSDHWITLLRARAIENQIYIFAVNCQGEVGGIYYSGDSCIINPNGEVMEILSDTCGLILRDIDDDVDKYRCSFPILNDIKNNIILKDF